MESMRAEKARAVAQARVTRQEEDAAAGVDDSAAAQENVEAYVRGRLENDRGSGVRAHFPQPHKEPVRAGIPNRERHPAPHSCLGAADAARANRCVAPIAQSAIHL